MAYTGQIIDIFVSSPGDVSRFRDNILTIVQSWNQRNGRNRRLFFNCLRWEDLVAPDVGESGQDVINSQIGDRYDIFLGVMWGRFGTPTNKADSGTEEEFDRAILRHKSGEPIKVSFLFCTSDIPYSELDGEQIVKVQTFKKRAQSEGCLTRDFVDDASLINGINLILDKFSNTWKNSLQINVDLLDKKDDIEIADRQCLESKKSLTDDRGLLDVIEDFEEHNGIFTGIIGEWGIQLESIVVDMELLTERMSELNKFGNASPQAARPIINDFTTAMDKFGSWCEEKISDLESQMDFISQDSLLLVELSDSVNDSISDIEDSFKAMNELSQSIFGANESIQGFVQALEELPKLDKKLNKANRKVIDSHRRLAEKNRIFREDILLCASELEERIANFDN